MSKQNITGATWGTLVGLYRLVMPRFGRPKIAHAVCQCTCGTVVCRTLSDLNSGDVKSCGCQKGAMIRERFTTHGRSKTGLYRRWQSMIHRCEIPSDTNYPKYGARGIKICDRWRNSFENFLADMGEPPTLSHSIDRIDNNGDYEPSNCRWATTEEQAYNKRNTRVFEYQGQKFYAKDCKRILGISRELLKYHMSKGLSLEQVAEKFQHKRAV